MKIKAALKLLKAHRKILASERDNLRDIRLKFEEQEDNCSSAMDDLDACINTLSEYV